MDSLVSFGAVALGSLFAVLNPFATVPPFIAMTESDDETERKRMARNACLVAASVLVVFTLSGLTLLRFFGVSVPAFQIAGGLVLLRVSFDLLQGNRSRMAPEEHSEGTAKDDISITPLGVPLLCGPATITTAILVSSQAETVAHMAVLLGIIALLYVMIDLFLALAARHVHRLGRTPILITSRLMGLILVAVAVQFLVDGIAASGLLAG